MAVLNPGKPSIAITLDPYPTSHRAGPIYTLSCDGPGSPLLVAMRNSAFELPR